MLSEISFILWKKQLKVKFEIDNSENIKISIFSNFFTFKEIVKQRNEELILHPAIKKLIQTKWNLFGRTYAITANLANIFYVLLATTFVFAVPLRRYDNQLHPFEHNVWKVVVGCLFLLMSAFYVWKVSLKYLI